MSTYGIFESVVQRQIQIFKPTLSKPASRSDIVNIDSHDEMGPNTINTDIVAEKLFIKITELLSLKYEQIQSVLPGGNSDKIGYQKAAIDVENEGIFK